MELTALDYQNLKRDYELLKLEKDRLENEVGILKNLLVKIHYEVMEEVVFAIEESSAWPKKAKKTLDGMSW